MARVAFGCTLGQSLGQGQFNASAFAAAPLDLTAVEAAIAVLEADGASPTQAHVNSLRTVWNTLSAATTANNVSLQIDNAVVTTQNGLKAAVAALLKTAQGSGLAP